MKLEEIMIISSDDYKKTNKKYFIYFKNYHTTRFIDIALNQAGIQVNRATRLGRYPVASLKIIMEEYNKLKDIQFKICAEIPKYPLFKIGDECMPFYSLN